MEEIAEIASEAPLADLMDFAIENGVDRIHFRAGCLPLLAWHGIARQVNTRPLRPEDTESIAGVLLDWACVPEAMTSHPQEAARALSFLCDPPCEGGLLHVAVSREDRGLSLAVDVVRPISRS